MIKFIYFEKATRFCEIFTFFCMYIRHNCYLQMQSFIPFTMGPSLYYVSKGTGRLGLKNSNFCWCLVLFLLTSKKVLACWRTYEKMIIIWDYCLFIPDEISETFINCHTFFRLLQKIKTKFLGKNCEIVKRNIFCSNHCVFPCALFTLRFSYIYVVQTWHSGIRRSESEPKGIRK